MSMVLQTRLSEPPYDGERFLDGLAGESFTMDCDEVPVRMDVPGFGECVLCFIDVRFDVHVHRGGDYSIKDVKLKCTRPPVRGKWPAGTLEVPVSRLRVGQHSNYSLFDLVSSAVASGCASAIEDRISEMAAQL